MHISLSNGNDNSRYMKIWQMGSFQLSLRRVSYKNIVDIVVNPDNLPRWSCNNYKRILSFMDKFDNDNDDDKLVLLSYSEDISPNVRLVEEIEKNINSFIKIAINSFNYLFNTDNKDTIPKLKQFNCKPFIKWNKSNHQNILKHFIKYSSFLSEDDLILLNDPFIWNKIGITETIKLSTIDTLSVILTGYTFENGMILQSTKNRLNLYNPNNVCK